jgi:glutathione S-transferase
MNRTLDVATSALSTGLSLGLGGRVVSAARQPARLLELYDFETCPYCRKVREALSSLDLDAMILPCPPGGTRFRPRVRELGGKTQFPYLVDPNEDRRMYESNDIIRYLVETYGAGRPPVGLRLGPLTNLRATLGSVPRAGRVKRAPSKEPAEPLELWSYEASPFSRIAREALCNLELPYVLHNVAKGSPKRGDFIARSGKMMVPFLHDPNTRTSMFESADIVRYLEETYAA